jgi:hypothetical protein
LTREKNDHYTVNYIIPTTDIQLLVAIVSAFLQLMISYILRILSLYISAVIFRPMTQKGAATFSISLANLSKRQLEDKKVKSLCLTI